MNKRFLIFILVMIAIVSLLVIIDRGRDNPWDSDVFFGQNNLKPIQVKIDVKS